MAIEPVPLVAGLAAFLPGLGALFVLYGAFDGYFRDNVVFLWFVGGLILGAPVSLFGAYLLVFTPLYYVLGAPLLDQGAKLVFLNRRKWQGDRHAVWNGGAVGAGLGTMVALVWAYTTFRDTGGWALDTAAVVVLLAAGVAFVHVATGLALGVGVHRREPFRAYALAAALTVPLAFLLFAHRQLPIDTGTPLLLFPALVTAYGVALLVVARRRWIPEGVGAAELRRIRRESRARRRGPADPGE